MLHNLFPRRNSVEVKYGSLVESKFREAVDGLAKKYAVSEEFKKWIYNLLVDIALTKPIAIEQSQAEKIQQEFDAHYQKDVSKKDNLRNFIKDLRGIGNADEVSGDLENLNVGDFMREGFPQNLISAITSNLPFFENEVSSSYSHLAIKRY